ncbi:MAG: ArsR/SmtB family transcription factor [Candidatus Bipolaricaulota bacterium]
MQLDKLVGLLKTASHPKRLRIMALLAEFDREVCVCEFVDALDLPQYQVSQHLRELRNNNLVEGRREGTWVYYSLSDDDSAESRGLIQGIVKHLDREDYAKQVERLEERFRKRENGKCIIGYDDKG